MNRRLDWHPGSLPIRLRLTFWYGAMLALTLALFGVLIYILFERNLYAQLDARIADRAAEVQRSVQTSVTRFPVPTVSIPPANVFASANTFVQIAALDGEVISRSANLGDQSLPIDEIDISAARSGQPLYQTVTVGGEKLRMFHLPLVAGSRIVGLIQVAESTEGVEDALARLRLTLLVTAAASVAGSVLIGLALAREALRPIRRMTRTASGIGESQDFTRRVAYTGPDDEVGRLAGTFNSMLARLQAAFGEVQTANERLAAALTAQRRFVADASHELRTPLTTIRGNASLLKRPELVGEDREDVIEQILSESERMARLVHDLLTLARADAGQHIQQQPVAIGPLVEDVARQATLLTDEHEIGLGPLTHAAVVGDRDYLRQLLLILVDNAIKYSPPDGRVTLRAAQQDGQVTITVEDTGLGIAPADLPHVFERFWRADRARSAGGTGLGLAIAKWIVDEHHGTIEVQSRLGVGTAFTVTLPRAADPVTDRPPEPAPPRQPSAAFER